MRKKKVRGHGRRWKPIDDWVAAHKHLDLDDLMRSQRHYVKIYVHPWSGFSLQDSEIPEPNGETKGRMLRGLIEIYDSWKQQLQQQQLDHYLRIWLYEPRFSRSQVVCAIGDFVDFYGSTFHKPDTGRSIHLPSYGKLADAMRAFDWECRLDEDHFDNSEPGDPEWYPSLQEYQKRKRWFRQLLKGPHRRTVYSKPIGDATEGYSFKRGYVWIGGK